MGTPYKALNKDRKPSNSLKQRIGRLLKALTKRIGTPYKALNKGLEALKSFKQKAYEPLTMVNKG